MTWSLFLSIITLGSILNVIMTNAIKQYYYNQGKDASPNVIALINSLVCGGGVTAVVYVLMSIPWTINNIICLICVIFFNWLSSMTSYDKMIQTLEQMAKAWPKDDNLKNKEN